MAFRMASPILPDLLVHGGVRRYLAPENSSFPTGVNLDVIAVSASLRFMSCFIFYPERVYFQSEVPLGKQLWILGLNFVGLNRINWGQSKVINCFSHLAYLCWPWRSTCSAIFSCLPKAPISSLFVDGELECIIFFVRFAQRFRFLFFCVLPRFTFLPPT